jgi:hypothetical protein
LLFLFPFVLPACSDVTIGSDAATPDGGSASDRPDSGLDVRPDGPADLAVDTAIDAAIDAPIDAAICSGANPATQACRKSANDCIPSTCLCSAEGRWGCSADCRSGLPLCADGGVQPIDALICAAANPAAQTCRKSANDCIPSSCSCAEDGNWRCTADCPQTLPLCADGGAPPTDVRSPIDAYVAPTDESSCLRATNVPECLIGRPHVDITRAAGGGLLAKVEVRAGSCIADVCNSQPGCSTIGVSGGAGAASGDTCDILATSIDGRAQSVSLSVVVNPSASRTCCGTGAGGNGMWMALNGLTFSVNPVVVDFTIDGGASSFDLGGEAPANP